MASAFIRRTAAILASTKSASVTILSRATIPGRRTRPGSLSGAATVSTASPPPTALRPGPPAHRAGTTHQGLQPAIDIVPTHAESGGKHC